MLKLFTYCTSPFRKSNPTAKFSARKCSVSSASACASVIGGISLERGSAWNPVKLRRAYWIRTRSGLVFVAGEWKSSGRLV
jgi:hypothetical protein